MFWFFGHEAYGISALWPGIKPAPPALEGKVLTTGPPGKSPMSYFKSRLIVSIPVSYLSCSVTCLVSCQCVGFLLSFLMPKMFCWELATLSRAIKAKADRFDSFPFAAWGLDQPSQDLMLPWLSSLQILLVISCVYGGAGISHGLLYLCAEPHLGEGLSPYSCPFSSSRLLLLTAC